ncbi:MAG: ATP-dependent sacrificial sulfur transferase LarE [Deltaproteobacteria bacterium]|nr:ATP-dependent sacrificial sulfur transferase LarE [Deltaproteobacteria bacterium]
MKEIQDTLRERKHVAVLLSGGLDSTLLSYLAHEALGENALAVTVDSPIVPRSDIRDALASAREIGIRHEVVAFDELQYPDFAANPPERCYLCRKMRDRLVREIAGSFGIETVADGMNLDDLDDYRPGMQAADEDGIWHPFIEHKVTKAAIREHARRIGLSAWNKQSDACLCSRFAYGLVLNKERLSRVEQAETFLKKICPGHVRVRCFPLDAVLLEVEKPEDALRHREEIVSVLMNLGFSFVGLDMEGYVTGKMNRMIAR